MSHSHCYLTLTFVIIFSINGKAQNIPMPEDTTHAHEYFAIAEKLSKEARYDSANIYFEKASAIYEKSARMTDNQQLWEQHINCLNKVGDNLRRIGEYEKAEKYIYKALKIGLNKLSEKNPLIADSYHNIGVIYRKKGGYDKAIEYYNKSLAIRLETLGEKHPKVADSYNNIGIVCRSKGDYDKAMENYHKSLAIRLETQGEKHPDVAISYNNIGNVYLLKSDYDKAMEYYHRSLAIRLETLGEKHPKVTGSYNNIGIVYEKKGDYDKAMEYYHKSLAIRLETLGEKHPDVARSYINIGIVCRKNGDYDKAMEYYHKSLAIKFETQGEKHPDVARSYYNIGVVYCDNGDYDKAIEYYNKSLAIWLETQGEKHPDVAGVYYEIGELYFKRNSIEKALIYAQMSLSSLVADWTDSNIYVNPPLRNISAETVMFLALELKADAFRRLFELTSHNSKNLYMALSTYQLAIELIGKIRSGYKTEGSKLFLGEKTSSIYNKAIQTALQVHEIVRDDKYKEEAFLFAEKSKSAVLFESLNESKAKRFAGIPDSLLKFERDLKIDLTFYESVIQKEKLKQENQDSLKLRNFENRFFNLKREYEAFMELLEQDYPRYYELKYRTETASVAAVQKMLNPQTALLEYFLGDSVTYIFAITQNQYEVVPVPRDSLFEKQLQALVNSFKSFSGKSDYLQGASFLYQKLIEPVAAQLIGKQKLVIIPDGELSRLPFETLLTKPVSHVANADYDRLPYLINHYEISYHYSATLYLNAFKNPAPDSYAYDFAGFAPVFSRKNNRITSSKSDLFSWETLKEFWTQITRDGAHLDELPFSEQEVTRIREMFPAERRQIFLHREASEEHFKTNTGDTRFVHLATHGFVYGENPKLSNLVFSQPQDSIIKGEDGFLYSGETYNLDLNADLLVLSACESGTGKLARGEGLMALTRGFLYSGARNIIASLWKVFDEHTSLMMAELYEEILSGKDYSTALREAKLKMITNSATARPQSWASFVLIGR